MNLNRRTFLLALGALGVARNVQAFTAEDPLPLERVVVSPWMANQVALTRGNLLFLGLPRYAKDKPTPSLARREADGSLRPFPGNGWNEWQPGKDGRNAFVYLNSVHIFADDTVWCVDQGALSAGVFSAKDAVPQPGAQKLVQLDAHSGEILQILRFDERILPPGAQMNDLRFHGNALYITDSGLGGIIVHDMVSGKTLRRLSATPVVKASDKAPPAMLSGIKGSKTFHPPNSDMIEITADGNWLYWAAPTGPLYRVETRWLQSDLPDEDILPHVEQVYDNNFSGGCCMDSAGNVYFSETVTHNIRVLAPSGETRVIASDVRLLRPDGTFISADRQLYIPVKQPLAAQPGAAAHFAIYKLALPDQFQGLNLGGPITG
ncbi:hypothetical protein L579_4394 [Pantoea sp. AS-PWVM4]|uniref:hypothetical protein n=1 Tax=Pantoea sp. AS-PWVM4 TaxID=1332069 RepID=UPI0003AC5D28|nr:hypothetical protein [Pantoea sp. AS-PWVM4]ERK16118.1 hypothetical protein L579_4394 [Pantoea sp. AS-PWVM4]